MNQTRHDWQWWARAVSYVVMAAVVYSYLLGMVLTEATSPDPTYAWVNPNVMAVKRVSPVPAAQTTPNLFSNLDCNLVTYRLVASPTMQTGCFTETAYGWIDSDTDTVIFNGTDEGLPLLANAPNEVLAPWPRSQELVTLDPLATGGTYLSLYRNPLALAKDQRNLLFQLTAKQLIGAPDLQLVDKTGQRLVINPQTLTFSDGGSWLVAETLNGSFVRINLATLEVKAFAPSFGSQGSPSLLKSYLAITDNGHYVAIANPASNMFKLYDLTACTGTSVRLEPENCTSYDYQPFITSQIAGLQSIRHVRFVNDGLVSFEATTSNPANSGIYEVAPAAQINSLIDYLGLGDSYTSGEGAFDYLAGTDTAENMCHLSVKSYPLLLTNDLFTSRGGHSVACSGAVIDDVGGRSETYKGQVSGVLDFKHLKDENPGLLNSIMTNFVPGYVAQQRFVSQYQPAITTVSVGGDDIGFGDILEQCVVPHLSRHLSDNTCFNSYEDRLELMQLIDRTQKRWTALYKQLQRQAPQTRLYAIGYPQVISDSGSCAINVQLDRSEAEFAIEITDYLNDAIRQSAEKAGIVYVDISQALAGHRLCEAASSNVAVNGITAGKDAGILGLKVIGKESYHPNAFGQQLIEQAILRQTHNLTLAPPASSPSTAGQKLATAPKTGRQVTARQPAKITQKVVKPGKATSVKVSGKSTGLKPNTSYNVRLAGTSGVIVGSGTTNSDGDLETLVTIPPGTPPGGQTIDVAGENQAGDPTDVTQPVYVPVSETDSDGDSIPDTIDSCPTAVNSGVDADQDGTDDICDGSIGQPPTQTPPPATAPPSEPPPTESSAGTSQGDSSTPGSTHPFSNLSGTLLSKQSAAGKAKPLVSLPFNKPVPRQAAAPLHGANANKLQSIKLQPRHWWFWLILWLLIWLVVFLISYYLFRYLEQRRRVEFA